MGAAPPPHGLPGRRQAGRRGGLGREPGPAARGEDSGVRAGVLRVRGAADRRRGAADDDAERPGQPPAYQVGSGHQDYGGHHVSKKFNLRVKCLYIYFFLFLAVFISGIFVSGYYDKLVCVGSCGRHSSVIQNSNNRKNMSTELTDSSILLRNLRHAVKQGPSSEASQKNPRPAKRTSSLI